GKKKTQKKKKRDGAGVPRPDPGGADAFDEAEHDPADDRAGHAAESAQHADDKGFAQEGRAVEWGDREDDAEQRPGRARHQRADAEGNRVYALDVDSHQRG